MVATSVGITAQVLAAKGLLQERASRIILAAAVIDAATLAIGFTLIVVKWGTRTMKRVVPRVHEQLRGGEPQFAMAMILLFALSVLAVYAGVAAIIGAFQLVDRDPGRPGRASPTFALRGLSGT